MSNFKSHTKSDRFRFRRRRVRGKISGTAARPRLSVFRSHRQIYVQLIDDAAGRTFLGFNDKNIKIKSRVSRAKELGLELAKRAVAKKIKQVVFDRGGYRYTGRVRALAEGAREGGLIF
ncbi:MAG: 50S ribosomal protein L18 [Candidatus Vogelbacteria bacterium]|nr:50S ribosomal protein L18 [Candidatus Vogelbacteria bacterium]